MKKGIILAGGTGSRLYPLSLVGSKQLQPIYDKPMIYYPLCTLMQCGIRKICIISTPYDLPRFQALLGDGKQWGIQLDYLVQPTPAGIAQAFLVAEDFIQDDDVTLILGDNLFYGQMDWRGIAQSFTSGGLIFAYAVQDPQRYGVIEFDAAGRAISIEEKPQRPKSRYAVPGIYLYDHHVIEICHSMKPSARNELEITDVNKTYLARGELCVKVMERGMAWLDTGTSSSLQEAGNFIAIIEQRQGLKINCPEEVALRYGYIEKEDFERLVHDMPKCEYSTYLKSLLTHPYELGHLDNPFRSS